MQIHRGRGDNVLRVFLVEDESIIRETLRDTVPWTQYGYTFVGEAGDGELALPLIRQTKPDLLITDIRMPFMDGLALSKMVLREFPQMKVIIISGYDDFEYAQQAIGLGVERYLLKPVTKSNLLSVLEEVKTKIESERAQQNYRLQFQQEAQEYEQYARRRFFEDIFRFPKYMNARRSWIWIFGHRRLRFCFFLRFRKSMVQPKPTRNRVPVSGTVWWHIF